MRTVRPKLVRHRPRGVGSTFSPASGRGSWSTPGAPGRQACVKCHAARIVKHHQRARREHRRDARGSGVSECRSRIPARGAVVRCMQRIISARRISPSICSVGSRRASRSPHHDWQVAVVARREVPLRSRYIAVQFVKFTARAASRQRGRAKK